MPGWRRLNCSLVPIAGLVSAGGNGSSWLWAIPERSVGLSITNAIGALRGRANLLNGTVVVMGAAKSPHRCGFINWFIFFPC